MANRTTLVDNNTWNNSQFAVVGKAMSSPEEKAYKIMKYVGEREGEGERGNQL